MDIIGLKAFDMVSYYHLQVKRKNLVISKKNSKYFKILFKRQNYESKNW